MKRPLNNAEMPTELTEVRLEIEAIPPTINTLSRKHWSYRHRQKSLWSQLISVFLERRDERLLLAWKHGGQRVRIEIAVHHNREFDPDNLHSVGKIPLDCLKTLGFITDDKSQYVEFAASQVKSKNPLTVITIRPVGAEYGKMDKIANKGKAKFRVGQVVAIKGYDSYGKLLEYVERNGTHIFKKPFWRFKGVNGVYPEETLRELTSRERGAE